MGRLRTHGQTDSVEHKAWRYQHQTKIQGYAGTFEEFYAEYGPRPSPEHHWSKKYDGWHCGSEMQPLWEFLSWENIQDLIAQVRKMCDRGGYDVDEATTEFWKFRLETAKDPVKMASYRIKVYLPRIMSQKLMEKTVWPEVSTDAKQSTYI
jgi:hypothetical protein